MILKNREYATKLFDVFVLIHIYIYNAIIFFTLGFGWSILIKIDSSLKFLSFLNLSNISNSIFD